MTSESSTNLAAALQLFGPGRTESFASRTTQVLHPGRRCSGVPDDVVLDAPDDDPQRSFVHVSTKAGGRLRITSARVGLPPSRRLRSRRNPTDGGHLKAWTY